MFGEKQTAIQSAGMEDGLIDLVVVQLLVHMHNREKAFERGESTESSLTLDAPNPWSFDVELEF
ncbi:MAG TPA: hypothetical protein V6C81_28105 [Planktothrix sp.]